MARIEPQKIRMLGPKGTVEVIQFPLLMYRQITVCKGVMGEGWDSSRDEDDSVEIRTGLQSRAVCATGGALGHLVEVASSGEVIWFVFFSLGSANVHLFRL